MASLLPPPLASDERSQAFEGLTLRFDGFDLSPLAVYLIDLVTADALPLLAEQFGVMGYYGWAFAADEAARRELVKTAIRNKRTLGTPGAVKRGLGLLGFPLAEVWEHWQSVALRGTAGGYLDGRKTLDGTKLLDGPHHPESRYLTGQWAEYVVYLHAELAPAGRSVDDVRRLCELYAPARSRLIAVVEEASGGIETIHSL